MAGSELYEQELPNPYGGEPIPAEATIEVVTDHPAAGCTVIRQVVTPRPGALHTMMDRLAEIAGLDADRAARLRRAGDDMKLENEILAIHDPASGWPISVEATKRMESTGQNRTDVLLIEAQ